MRPPSGLRNNSAKPFPEDEAPRDLLHDRDRVFAALAATASGMSIEKIRTALFPVAEKIGPPLSFVHPTQLGLR
jgi:hypothetical protein